VAKLTYIIEQTNPKSQIVYKSIHCITIYTINKIALFFQKVCTFFQGLSIIILNKAFGEENGCNAR